MRTCISDNEKEREREGERWGKKVRVHESKDTYAGVCVSHTHTHTHTYTCIISETAMMNNKGQTNIIMQT